MTMGSLGVILFMSEFYNKYKRLFNQERTVSNNRSQFINLYHEIAAPKKGTESTQGQKKKRDSGVTNMGRSPALDQFERQILPRLKTEPDNIKIRDASQLFSPSQFHHQLPKLTPVPRYQKFTEITNIHPRRHQAQPPNLFKQFDDRFTSDRESIKYEKEFQQWRAMLNRKKQAIEAIKTEPERYRSIKMENKERPIQNSPSNITPIKPLHRSPNNDSSRRKGISAFQPQLYGLNENPYAFANAKLEDIKLIDRFYSKGTVNQYKKCLLRRRQMKNDIGERREKLRRLLEEEKREYYSRK